MYGSASGYNVYPGQRKDEGFEERKVMWLRFSGIQGKARRVSLQAPNLEDLLIDSLSGTLTKGLGSARCPLLNLDNEWGFSRP